MRLVFLLAFLLLTKPDGTPIWINPGEVMTLQRATRPEWPAPCRTIVRMHDGSFCVREVAEDIAAAIGKAD